MLAVENVYYSARLMVVVKVIGSSAVTYAEIFSVVFCSGYCFRAEAAAAARDTILR